ncbi:Membrane-associated phospholipid phosphatase [Butyrivibrio sp. INlla21]|nr:Membrane-associated phospholipid phosphatase [Butyrivibrio sp. INlla21]
MDINYLLYLQELRESAPEWFNYLIQLITDTAGGILLVFIPMLIFFCVDKKKGEFIWLSLSMGSLVNVFLKNVFCVYRPWIRSELIKPTAEAIEGAGDYSFPSSHTQGSASAFGSVAYVYRKKKVISIICICLVLLVAFSRNYLGVHTPQDVLVGMLVAVIGIALAGFVQKRVEGSEKKRLLFYCITVAVTAVAMIFVCLKDYPVDYNAAGDILYDPMRSISSFASKAGLTIGFLTAWILEEKYVVFTTDNLSVTRRIIRAVIGIALYFVAAIMASVVSSPLPVSWLSAFVQNLIMYFCLFYFAPLIFTKIESRSRT